MKQKSIKDVKRAKYKPHNEELKGQCDTTANVEELG